MYKSFNNLHQYKDINTHTHIKYIKWYIFNNPFNFKLDIISKIFLIFYYFIITEFNIFNFTTEHKDIKKKG